MEGYVLTGAQADELAVSWLRIRRKTWAILGLSFVILTFWLAFLGYGVWMHFHGGQVAPLLIAIYRRRQAIILSICLGFILCAIYAPMFEYRRWTRTWQTAMTGLPTVQFAVSRAQSLQSRLDRPSPGERIAAWLCCTALAAGPTWILNLHGAMPSDRPWFTFLTLILFGGPCVLMNLVAALWLTGIPRFTRGAPFLRRSLRLELGVVMVALAQGYGVYLLLKTCVP